MTLIYSLSTLLFSAQALAQDASAPLYLHTFPTAVSAMPDSSGAWRSGDAVVAFQVDDPCPVTSGSEPTALSSGVTIATVTERHAGHSSVATFVLDQCLGGQIAQAVQSLDYFGPYGSVLANDADEGLYVPNAVEPGVSALMVFDGARHFKLYAIHRVQTDPQGPYLRVHLQSTCDESAPWSVAVGDLDDPGELPATTEGP